MLRRGVLMLVLAFGCLLTLVGTAVAGNFSPTAKFTLSTRKIKANPGVTISIVQEKGEEKMFVVKLTVPKGFNIASDSQIASGEVLGSGFINVAAAPLCEKTPANIPIRILERDRTPTEASQGIKAVWLIDLTYRQLQLFVRGTPTTGHTLSTEIPPVAAVCAPITFNATITPTSSVSRAKIFTNPSATGTYYFGASYQSDLGSVWTNKQAISITK